MAGDANVALLTRSDVTTVQGSTEVYYVTHHLAERHDLHLFAPRDPGVSAAAYKPLPQARYVPNLFLLNVVFLPYFLYYCWIHDVEVVYSYKEFHLTPYVASVLCGAGWVIDFRTEPTGQAREFAEIEDEFTLKHRLYYGLEDALYRLTLPRACAVLTLSEEIRDVLETGYRVSTERLHLVPSAVDTERFAFDRRSDGDDGDTIDLCYLGFIRRSRDLETVFEALGRSLTVQERIHLHVVGTGPDEDVERYRALVRSLDIENVVQWHGYVEHDDVPELLAQMDAGISAYPALDSYEVSSPVKIYEYLAMGLPVVGTDIAPHREVLEDGLTGFFYRPEDPADLGSTLERLVALDRDRWRSMRRAARETAEDNDWATRLTTVESVVGECRR